MCINCYIIDKYDGVKHTFKWILTRSFKLQVYNYIKHSISDKWMPLATPQTPTLMLKLLITLLWFYLINYTNNYIFYSIFELLDLQSQVSPILLKLTIAKTITPSNYHNTHQTVDVKVFYEWFMNFLRFKDNNFVH